MAKYQYMPLNDNVEEMFIGPFGSSLKNDSFVDESDAFCMVYEQKHAIKKTMNLETRYVNREKYEELKRFNIHGGDIIVSCRGTIGETYIVPDDAPLGIMHPSIMKIRLKPGVYNKQYFNLLLQNYLKQHEDEANGSGIKMAISAKELGATLFPVPNMAEQNQIASAFNQVEELIVLRKEQLTKLDQLVKSRFVELFGDLHGTNFPKCKMADICGIKHGYAFSGEFFTEDDNNILLVTPGNFKVGGGFQEKKCKFFTGEYPKEYVLNSGDLIVTMTDLSKNMDTLGYSAIVPCTYRVYLHNQRIGLFVNMSEKINRVFLMYFMQTNEYRDSIIASATGSTVHHTSPSKILDCDVFVPPLELQEQFAAFVEQTDKSKSTIQQSLNKLELLKKSLMQAYFG